MNVTLCSAFRNATHYLERYCRQVWELTLVLRDRGDRLECIWGEGDHTDKTWAMLRSYALGKEVDIVTVNHGGPDYGSVVNAERFANLSKVCNAIWARLPSDADAVIWCESDLVWEPATMLALLDDLAQVPAVAPMVMLEREPFPAGTFYDFWAARKGGKHISTRPPYFDGWDMQTPLQVDSAGSCLVMRGELARQVTWPAEDVVVGVCRQLYELGASVWLDPKASVIHL